MKSATKYSLPAGHRIQSRGLLAGVFVARSEGRAVTHSVVMNGQDDDVLVLCGRVKDLDNLADMYSFGVDDAPTCPACAKKDPRVTT